MKANCLFSTSDCLFIRIISKSQTYQSCYSFVLLHLHYSWLDLALFVQHPLGHQTWMPYYNLIGFTLLDWVYFQTLAVIGLRLLVATANAWLIQTSGFAAKWLVWWDFCLKRIQQCENSPVMLQTLAFIMSIPSRCFCKCKSSLNRVFKCVSAFFSIMMKSSLLLKTYRNSSIRNCNSLLELLKLLYNLAWCKSIHVTAALHTSLSTDPANGVSFCEL